jgi:hypothetical protein
MKPTHNPWIDGIPKNADGSVGAAWIALWTKSGFLTLTAQPYRQYLWRVGPSFQSQTFIHEIFW